MIILVIVVKIGEHISAAIDMDTTMDELSDAVFYMRSMPKLYKENPGSLLSSDKVRHDLCLFCLGVCNAHLLHSQNLQNRVL
jgi:hypothetical protein